MPAFIAGVVGSHSSKRQSTAVWVAFDSGGSHVVQDCSLIGQRRHLSIFGYKDFSFVQSFRGEMFVRACCLAIVGSTCSIRKRRQGGHRGYRSCWGALEGKGTMGRKEILMTSRGRLPKKRFQRLGITRQLCGGRTGKAF